MQTLVEIGPFFVWRYNAPMQPVNFPESSYNQIGASGACPHCGATGSGSVSFFQEYQSADHAAEDCTPSRFTS